MKRPIIAIDVDDVIADATESLRLQINERLNVDLKPEDYRVPGSMWGYYQRVWESHELLDRIDYPMYEAEMAADQMHVPLMPGAAFAIGEISKRFDIVIITARAPAWKPATERWLKEHFGDIIKSLHFAGNKHVKDTKTKGQQAKELGASYLIDDGPSNCRTALDEGLEAILFGEYGWHHEGTEGLTRCKDWPAVLEYFNDIR